MMMQSLSEKVVCFDLDDTLYEEKDFLCSAFNEISVHVAQQVNVAPNEIYKIMMMAYDAHRSPFQEINSSFHVDLSIEELLQMYRNHEPSIRLSSDMVDVLNTLNHSQCVLGLITDGRSITQRNKIKALGLSRFFSNENIVISEEFGSEKPAEQNYLYFEKKYPEARFFYVGDNLVKDFVTPNKLGWMSICLLDNGYNVHRQDFSISSKNLPRYVIAQPKEMIDLILSI